MRLSLFTDYSIRVLMYTAITEDRYVTTKEICDYYQISYHHLVKVVHKLGSVGFLTSRQGKNGGFQLATRASDLKLGQIVRAMEPDLHLVECFDATQNKCVVSSFCTVKKHLSDATTAFLKSLDGISLEDVVRDQRNSFLKKKTLTAKG